MAPTEEDLLHALRRNGVGARVLVALLHVGPSTITKLSRVTGSPRTRVRFAVHGRPPDCKMEHALRQLRFVHVTRVGRRERVELTDVGRRWALRVEDGLFEPDIVARAIRRVGV